MLQAEGLTAVARLARQKRDVNIICFTGYRLESLVQEPPTKWVYPLLEQVDVLVDGPYIHSQNDGLGLRGSRNQRIIHLTSRLRHYHLENWARVLVIVVQSLGALSNILYACAALATPVIYDIYTGYQSNTMAILCAALVGLIINISIIS